MQNVNNASNNTTQAVAQRFGEFAFRNNYRSKIVKRRENEQGNI